MKPSREEAFGMPITALRIGADALYKDINDGARKQDAEIEYLVGFVDLAGRVRPMKLA